MDSGVVISVNSWRNTCILVAPESAPHDHQMAACGFEKQERQMTPVVSLTTECRSSHEKKHPLGKILWYSVHQKGHNHWIKMRNEDRWWQRNEAGSFSAASSVPGAVTNGFAENQGFAEKDLFAETEVSFVKTSVFQWKFYQKGFLNPL